jgi:hypothetical protein
MMMCVTGSRPPPLAYTATAVKCEDYIGYWMQ